MNDEALICQNKYKINILFHITMPSSITHNVLFLGSIPLIVYFTLFVWIKSFQIIALNYKTIYLYIETISTQLETKIIYIVCIS